MPRRETGVSDLIDLEPGEQPKPDPEAAADALGAIDFTGEAPQAAPEPLRPTEAPKLKRRTKAELEAEVVRLAAEVERQQQAAAANAPSLIQSMVTPLAMTFKAAGNIVASWRGDFWKLGDNEAQSLGEAWAPCVGPVLAKRPELVIWAAAIAATYSVAYPRLQMEKTIAAQKLAPTDLTAQPPKEPAA